MGVVLAKSATLQRDAAFPSALGGGSGFRRSSQSLIASVAISSLGAVAPWNQMSPDGISWDSGISWIKDQYGKWIAIVSDNSNSDVWAWSNDDGATFTSSIKIDAGELTRGSIAYDSIHDQMHVLFRCVNNDAGILYRRFAITRDAGTHAITDISAVRITGVNPQLDFFNTSGAVTYECPQIFFLTDNPAWQAGTGHGAILCVWSVFQTGAAANGAEVRASMRVLSNTTADNTVTNWIAPGAAGSSGITQGPVTGLPWTKIFGGSGVSNEAFGVTTRLAVGSNALNLVIVYYDATAAKYRVAIVPWRGTPNYDFAGTIVRFDLVAMKAAVTQADVGYTLKTQLTSHISHNTGTDRLYLGVGTWAGDGVSGDQWRVCEIDLASSNAVTTTVVYQAPTALCDISLFVAGAVHYDSTSGLVLVTYTDLINHYGYIVTYNRASSIAQSAILFGSSAGTGAPLDIPTILPWRSTIYSLVIWRNFNVGYVVTPPTQPTASPPYQAYKGLVIWS